MKEKDKTKKPDLDFEKALADLEGVVEELEKGGSASTSRSPGSNGASGFPGFSAMSWTKPRKKSRSS